MVPSAISFVFEDLLGIDLPNIKTSTYQHFKLIRYCTGSSSIQEDFHRTLVLTNIVPPLAGYLSFEMTFLGPEGPILKLIWAQAASVSNFGDIDIPGTVMCLSPAEPILTPGL